MTVNGQALPYTMTNTALGTVVIQNASLDLTSRTPAPAYSAVVNGTVSRGRLTVNGSGTYTGSLSGAALTVNNLNSCTNVQTSANGTDGFAARYRA